MIDVKKSSDYDLKNSIKRFFVEKILFGTYNH